MKGWIRLHRKLLESSFSNKPFVGWLFINLLLLANHKENKFLWNNQEILIKKGQLLTGLLSLSQQTGLSFQNVRTALEALKSTNTITIKSTNKFSIISILKWEQYQEELTNNLTSKLTNNQQTTNKQLTTNKNDNNVKNVRIYTKKYSSIEDIKPSDLVEISNRYKIPLSLVQISLEEMKNWLEAKGRKYKNYKRGLMNWVLSKAQKAIERRQGEKRGIDLQHLG